MSFNKFDESAAGKIRPRFNFETPLKKEEIMDLIHSHGLTDPTIVCSKYGRFIRLSIPKKAQHTWSPVLNLSFDQQENRTLIRCLIGPSETVWQSIMLFYIAFSILGFFGSIYALVRWNLSGSMDYLFIIPLSIAFLFSIFLVSRQGKIKAHLEMLHLLRFLRKAVDEIEFKRVEEN
jgi:hypothetical protein